MPIQDRANVVCVQCHARKVKCDLQSSTDDTCRNCRRANQTCVRRDGVRKRRRQTTQRGTEMSNSPMPCITPRVGAPLSPLSAPSNDMSNTTPARTESFIDHRTVLSWEAINEPTVAENSLSRHSTNMRDTVLASTEAAVLPKPALLRAFVDNFAEHMFHSYPVVDQSDLQGTGSSVLLQQALCLAGSLMRHDSEALRHSHVLYERVKLLLSINCEDDPVQVLKTLCLMTCWSPKPPGKISLDGPWHWTGIATRLAVQMGLHKESTYTQNPNAKCLRRIIWHLYCSERIQAACWGRPPFLRLAFIDTAMPTLNDFDVPNRQALLSLEITNLSKIMDVIAELNVQRRPIEPDELANVMDALRTWVNLVPEELQLHAPNGDRRPFYRPCSELYISYFVAIILAQMLKHKERKGPSQTSVLSLVAASCIVSLYDEIHCREQAVYLLPMNAFFCMSAALPLIYYRPKLPRKDAARKQELAVLCAVLTRMRDRYGGSDMVLGKIKKLESDVDKLLKDARGPYATIQETEQLFERTDGLFPFSATMCENMEMLELASTPYNFFMANNIVPVETDILAQSMPFAESFFMDDILDGMDLSSFDAVG